MTTKEILKEAFDSDLEVLDKAFKNDNEIFKDVQGIIGTYTSMIYKTLIAKGIITIEEFQVDMKEAQDLMKEALSKREKEGIKE